MSSTKQITVIGATGKLGVPVVKNLVNEGFSVKVIVRNEEKASRFFGHIPEIEIVRGDLRDVGSLKKALEKTSVLYLNLSTNTIDRNIAFAAEREGVANILEAIDRKSIRQILAISGLGAFDNHYNPGTFQFIPNIIRKEGHRIIKESGIPYTILHCSSFIDNFIIYQRKHTYSVIGSTEFPVYFTNCYDYTLQLINAVGNSEAMFREFPVQGPDGLLHLEAAKKFLAIYDKKARANVMPAGMIKVMSLFIKEMKFVKHMSDYFSQSPEEFIAEENDTYRILGTPVTSLEEYAEKLKKEEIYDYLDL